MSEDKDKAFTTKTSDYTKTYTRVDGTKRTVTYKQTYKVKDKTLPNKKKEILAEFNEIVINATTIEECKKIQEQLLPLKKQ